jgi:hypothetical protein
VVADEGELPKNVAVATAGPLMHFNAHGRGKRGKTRDFRAQDEVNESSLPLEACGTSVGGQLKVLVTSNCFAPTTNGINLHTW